MSIKLPERLDLSQAEARFGVFPDSRRTRPLFFDGKFLTAADLNREQSYLLTRQADLARSLGFGVVGGLRVERSDKSASGVDKAAASVRITDGHGLTPAGRAVLLPQAKIVDLSDVPRLENLNAAFGLANRPQPAFFNLSGLFVLGLRSVEFTANPTPVFPPSLQGSQSLQDGEIIEATAVTLVPYDSPVGLSDPARARTGAAREIFLEQRPPRNPAGVLPLAMIFLRHGFLEWVDEFLVRREAGDDDRFGFGFAPRALAEAHFFHFRDLLDEVPAPPKDGRLAAADFFDILPPAGLLPAGAVDVHEFTQAFFPPEARVELTLVPEDELPGLMEESLDQPPIDLRLKPEDQDALAILVLAPVPRAGYRDALEELTVLKPLLRNVAPSLLGQQRPLQALRRLNQVLKEKVAGNEPTDSTGAALADAGWTTVLSKAPQLWYVRQRNLPFASDLAGKALPADTAPAILIQPEVQSASVGDDVTFRVVAIGSPPLAYQWRKDGADLPGEIAATLTAQNVQDDGAEYDVVVSNAADSTTSEPASIDFAQVPVIVGEPDDLTAPAGVEVRFQVTAQGAGPLAFQWRKNGADIPGATGPTLTLSAVQAADEAQYDVRVSNTAGGVDSRKAALAVEQPPAALPPSITSQPEDLTTPLGTSAAFSIAVAGTAPLEFQWRQDGVELAGETGIALTLNSVAAVSEGAYDVVVKNAAGGVTSASAKLTVQLPPAAQAPVIVTPPADVTTPAGTSATFAAVVTGSAPLDFQWQKDGADVPGARGISLTLTSLKAEDEGAYRIVVSNGAGSVTSAEAKLTVQQLPNGDPPVVARQPESITTPAGTNGVFTVNVTGTAPLQFQWRRDGADLPGAQSHVLSLPNVQTTNEGSYDVVVTNREGTVTSAVARLNIERPPAPEAPVITAQPDDVSAPAGTTVNFAFAVRGTAPFSIQWRKDGTDIPQATGLGLTLTNVQTVNQGKYDVFVANAAGKVQSRAATLKVEAARADPCANQQGTFDELTAQMKKLEALFASAEGGARDLIQRQIKALKPKLDEAKAALDTCRRQNPG